MLYGLFCRRSMIFLCLCSHSCVEERTNEQLLSLFSITHLQKNSFRMILNVTIKRVDGQGNSILVLHTCHVCEFGKLFLWLLDSSFLFSLAVEQFFDFISTVFGQLLFGFIEFVLIMKEMCS